MVLYGGCVESNRYNSVHIFCFDTGTWHELQPDCEPPPVAGHGGVYHDGKLYIFGGCNDDEFFGDVYELALEEGWVQGRRCVPHRRHTPCALGVSRQWPFHRPAPTAPSRSPVPPVCVPCASLRPRGPGPAALCAGTLVPGQPENCSAGGGGGDMDARRRRGGGSAGGGGGGDMDARRRRGGGLRGGGGGGDMDARRRRGGGGLEKWGSVSGPLFCVRTDVGAEGTGTQNLARKSFSHQ